MIKSILISFILIGLFSCAGQTINTAGVTGLSASEYENIVDKKTVKIESYNGLTNQLTVSATKLDSTMNEAILARSSQIYEWNSTTLQEEKVKASSNMANKTEFFVSFYTPERAHNNLNASKPLWKIYLDVNGQRYEGKATKIKSLLADLEALYPQHNRFASAYKVEFPVATNTVENQTMTLTFTGPNASAKLNF